MADYKRMVSYMYQYENGVKKKNVGYARIEAKNGQCKITLHMQLLGQLDSIFPTYLIQRDDNDTELIYLGDAVLKNKVIDSKLSAAEANIMGSGYKLSDVGGMLLFLNEDVLFATEWDDKPIVPVKILEALKPKAKKEEPPKVFPVEPSTVVPAKQPRVIPVEPRDMKQTDRMEEVNQEDRYAVNSLNQAEETDIVKKEKEEEITAEIEVEHNDLMDNNLSAAATEAMMPKYKFPRGWKTVEGFQREQSIQPGYDKNLYAKKEAFEQHGMEVINRNTGYNGNINGDSCSDKICDENILKENLCDEGVCEDEICNEDSCDDEICNDEISNVDSACENGYYGQDNAEEPNLTSPREEEMADPPLASHFFENYPRIYPFEDNEIVLCVKIEPKDIGFLPKDTWVLGNNSFLLHGYYCYHHLIFAKRKDRFGCNYILGIPGIYHNKEVFMARMFGFDCFKSVRKRELRQGDFGYWYIPITL